MPTLTKNVILLGFHRKTLQMAQKNQVNHLLLSTLLLLLILLHVHAKTLVRRQIDDGNYLPIEAVIEKRPFCNAFTGCGKRSMEIADDVSRPNRLSAWNRANQLKMRKIPYTLLREFSVSDADFGGKL